MRELNVFALFCQNLSWGSEALWGREAGGADFLVQAMDVVMAVWTYEKRSAVRSPTQRAALDFAPHCVFHTSILPLPRPSPAQGNPPRQLPSPKEPLTPRKDFGKKEQRH